MLNLSEFSPFLIRESGHKEFLFKSLTLSVSRGQCTGIIGPNGSGKSTLFKAIIGLFKQYEGELLISIDPCEVLLMNQNYRQSILPWLNVKQHLERSLSSEQRSNASVLLNRMKFSPTGYQKLRELSGGELQILLLSTLLAREPSLLLLDEPLSAIDFHRRKIAIEVLAEFRERRSMAMLIVSHTLSDLTHLSDSAFLISGQRSDKIRPVRVDDTLREKDIFKL
ncbi:ATP-binding cassette domain-containing protein [Pseudoalteromonas piscicida]|uniref:ATP-binding cassette domain-containing protein n=1 Tax=Pseudoalteromonas piscicida TaxID=43662 RepID=UPI0030C9164B